MFPDQLSRKFCDLLWALERISAFQIWAFPQPLRGYKSHRTPCIHLVQTESRNVLMNFMCTIISTFHWVITRDSRINKWRQISICFSSIVTQYSQLTQFSADRSRSALTFPKHLHDKIDFTILRFHIHPTFKCLQKTQESGENMLMKRVLLWDGKWVNKKTLPVITKQVHVNSWDS